MCLPVPFPGNPSSVDSQQTLPKFLIRALSPKISLIIIKTHLSKGYTKTTLFPFRCSSIAFFTHAVGPFFFPSWIILPKGGLT